MKRKISILTLTFLFFAATTGLPVTLHFCKMMESASLDTCEIHNIVEFSVLCCENELTEYQVKLTSENSLCCQSELIYNKVDDEFLFNKSNKSLLSSDENLFQLVALIPPSFYLAIQKSFYNDSSPPFLIDPDLHITNAVILI